MVGFRIELPENGCSLKADTARSCPALQLSTTDFVKERTAWNENRSHESDTSRVAGCRCRGAGEFVGQASRHSSETNRGSDRHHVYRRSLLEISCVRHRGPHAGGLLS